jgi:hypothetical protein
VGLNDLRRVIARARRGGRRVLLGGHSAGASAAVAYAAWDFGGRAGFRDLDGLVLVDGGMLGTFTVRTLTSVERALADIRTKGPWTDLLGLGLPWAAQLFAEIGGQAAARSPTVLSPFQSFPLLPPYFRPPIHATNRGILGFALDADTSPAFLRLIHVRAGRLGPTGDWRDARSPRSAASRRCSEPSARSTRGSGTTRSSSTSRSTPPRRCAAAPRPACCTYVRSTAPASTSRSTHSRRR